MSNAEDNPRIATRRVYTGRVINLDVDTVRFPDGSTGELGDGTASRCQRGRPIPQ